MSSKDVENPSTESLESIDNASLPKKESKWKILSSFFKGREEPTEENQVQLKNANAHPNTGGSENNTQKVRTAIEEDLEYIEKGFENEEGIYGENFPNVIMEHASNMIFELEDTPELGALLLCSIQQILFFLSSLVLISHLIVDKMNGTDLDKAKLISSVMLVSGLSTLLNLYFGIRISLLHGQNLIYLVPALAIVPYNETSNVFDKKIKELMGAIIVSSIFQVIVSYSGILNYFIELINPVVVSATILTVGLSFIKIGFFKAAQCVEIGIPEIIIFIVCYLYFRRTYHCSLKFLQINAIPVALLLTWFYAHLLTVSGSYDFKDCDFNPSGLRTLTPKCSASLLTRQQCKTDISDAIHDSKWIRFPYPFQFGKPEFKFESVIVYIISFIIVMIDSASTYHSTGTLVVSEPPPLVCVGRGIGMEGFCSLLAGMWGIASGVSPLNENVHNLAVSQVASRSVFAMASLLLILFSIFGKIGGLLASIPPSIIGGLLCIISCLTIAIGVSNLRYTQVGSSRNAAIIALSTFLSLSVTSYFEQYSASATHGPVDSNSDVFDKVLNTLFSESMVLAFFLSLFLDTTVPADLHEIGRYVWSEDINPRYWLPFFEPPSISMDQFEGLTAQDDALHESQEGDQEKVEDVNLESNSAIGTTLNEINRGSDEKKETENTKEHP